MPRVMALLKCYERIPANTTNFPNLTISSSSIVLPEITIALRRVHTMQVMLIGSKLICIVYVHSECALTAIHIECSFSQSTSIGSLKVNCIMTWNNAGVIFLCVIGYVKKPAIKDEITSVTLLLRLGKLLYLVCHV